MRLFIIGCWLLCVSPFKSSGQNGVSKTPLKLWATYYYVPTFKHHKKGIPLLDINKKKTGFKLLHCNWCSAAIEGTVFIKKGKKIHTLNYAGRAEKMQYNCTQCQQYSAYNNAPKTGKVLWQLSSGFGKGVNNFNLVPYKTIAVDPKHIPYGTVIYIPEAQDLSYKTPQGKTVKHNGYFFAGDTGSKITGNHIDVFLGTQTKHPFTFITSQPGKTFNAFVVTHKPTITSLKQQHQL